MTIARGWEGHQRSQVTMIIAEGGRGEGGSGEAWPHKPQTDRGSSIGWARV
jgi:hypothetical protein